MNTMSVRVLLCGMMAGLSGASHANDEVALSDKDKAPLVTLDTIEVTVQKRPERAHDIPRALSVLDQERLARERILSATDLVGKTPNLQGYQAGGVNALSIRGVGGGGRNIGFDTRVGVYWDGVYMGQAPALALPLAGVDQIEVLRGPQGALLGRNSVAGAVILRSLEIDPTPYASLRVAGQNYNGAHLTARAEGATPFGGRGRVVVDRRVRDGVIARDGSDWDNINRTSGRAMWETDNAWGAWRFYIDGAQVKERNSLGLPVSGFFSQPLTAEQPQSQPNITPYSELTSFGVGGAWSKTDQGQRTWTVSLGRRDLDQQRRSDLDYSADDLLGLIYRDQWATTSLEARVASDPERRARWVVGVYAAQDVARSNRLVNIGTDTGTRVFVPGLGSVPFGAAFALQPGFGAQGVGRVESDQMAVFAMWDFDATERLTTHVGGRFGREVKTARYDLDGSGSGRLGIATIDGYHDRKTSQAFSPTIGLSWKINERAHVYTTYSEGVKSGGWNLDFLNRAQAVTGFDFEDEHVDNIEMGVKHMGDRFWWNGSVFQTNIKDHQVFQFVPLGGGGSVLQLRNAARATSRGVEFEGGWNITENTSVFGGVGLLDAKFDDFPQGGAAGQNLAGNFLPDAPKRMAHLGARHRVDTQNGWVDLSWAGRYRSESYTGADNTLAQKLGSHTVHDARVSYTPNQGDWSVAVFAQNLTDEDAAVYKFRDFFGHEAQKNLEPRQVGVEVVWNF